MGFTCEAGSVGDNVDRHGKLFHCVSTAVPSLLEERRQQASDHAAAAEAVQEPNHFRLQDSGCGVYQHG